MADEKTVSDRSFVSSGVSLGQTPLLIIGSVVCVCVSRSRNIHPFTDVQSAYRFKYCTPAWWVAEFKS